MTEQRRHDHEDTTTFGWTVTTQRADKPAADGTYVVKEHRLPVPAWHFTCVACRGTMTDLEGVGATCDVWTVEGARWRREHASLFPGQLEIALDDKPVDNRPGGMF